MTPNLFPLTAIPPPGTRLYDVYVLNSAGEWAMVWTTEGRRFAYLPWEDAVAAAVGLRACGPVEVRPSCAASQPPNDHYEHIRSYDPRQSIRHMPPAFYAGLRCPQSPTAGRTGRRRWRQAFTR